MKTKNVIGVSVAEGRIDFWRGAQPDDDPRGGESGWSEIADLIPGGVVIKLNTEAQGSDAPAERYGLTVVRHPIDDLHQVLAPPLEQVEFAVATMRDAARRPLYIHCTHGQDRTGLVCAVYRVRAHGWSKADAYDEAIRIGFHPALVGLLRAWRELA